MRIDRHEGRGGGVAVVKPRSKPRLVSIRDMIKERRRTQQPIDPPYWKPKTRRDCENMVRPCPYVSCRHNLYLDVTENGSIKYNFPHLEPGDMKESCALDVAARGGLTLEETGALMNVTRERIRQIQEKVAPRLRRAREAVR